jgi:hypothetical protein
LGLSFLWCVFVIVPLDAALRIKVIDITAAIAIGGAGDGGKWTMAPRKRWFWIMPGR